jgi:acyl-CoA synthetase (AMP-forming)/AMP-acid ligase II
MLIVRGVNLYPSQTEEVLMSFPEVATTYQIHVGREGSLDTLTVKVELYPKMFDGDLRQLKRLEADLTKSIQDEIVIRPKVEFHEPPGSLHDVLCILRQEAVYIEDCYGFVVASEQQKKAIIVLVVADPAATRKLLGQHGLQLIGSSELYSR